MRYILISICIIAFLTSCTNYSDEQFFSAIKSGDAKKVQDIINQRDMTKVRDGNSYGFDKNNNLVVIPMNNKLNQSAINGGFSGLWLAIDIGRPEIIEVLLQQKFDFAEKHVIFEDVSISLRELAVMNKSCPTTIKLLQKKGVDFNRIEAGSSSPVIHVAADQERWNCVYALIETGANTNVFKHSGEGLLSAAVLSSTEVDIDYLIKKMNKFDPLSVDSELAFIFAAQRGNSKLVKNFLNRGFNSCHNRQGKNIRDYAYENNHLDTAALLPTKDQCMIENR